MQFYAKYIFAPLMDWSLRRPEIEELRAELIAQASGEVLEIGYGTGLNLRHYTADVRGLTLIDPVELLPRRVEQRLAACRAADVIRRSATAERLPVADASQDYVVSTFTLCSVGNTAQSLAEIYRVLRPGGRFLLLEHGASDEPGVRRWQDRLNPLNKMIGCGCNLNRPIASLVERGGFRFAALDRLPLPGVPRIMAPLYFGIAQAAGP